MLLRISNWSTHFENNRTRELKKMDWVPVPTKQDGDGYTELVSHKNGAAHLGAWMAMVQVAAKCETRGTLMRDGRKPHDTTSLARISRLPAAVFAEAIPRLLAIGWLESEVVRESEVTQIPQEGAMTTAGPPQEGAASRAPAHAPATQQDSTGEDSTEQDKTQHDMAAAPVVAVSNQVGQIVSHYQTFHPKAKADEKLRSKIAGRLRDGFTVEDLKTAIDGCHRSPFHCGENDDHRKYQSLELIVRDADKVSQFIELSHADRAGPQLTSKSQRSMDSINRLIERHGNTNGN